MTVPDAAASSSASPPKAVDVESCSLITKVHHLIEECLVLGLDQEECVKALQQHARIDPIITATVWKELEKVNMAFFERYHLDRLARNHAHFDRILKDNTFKPLRGSLRDISNANKTNIQNS